MSVPEDQRNVGDLHVIELAKELCSHTLQVTHNETTFPKRYRYSVAAKIQEKAIDIYGDLVEANEFYPRTKRDAERRLYLQRDALAKTRSLMSYIAIAQDLFKFPMKKAAYWIGLVIQVRKELIPWYNSDFKRFQTLLK